MASVAALAKRTGDAQQRINDAVAALAEMYKVSAMPLAMHKEPAVRAMLQAENTAAFLESLIASSAQPEQTEQSDEPEAAVKRGRKKAT